MDICEYVLRESKDFFDKLSNGLSSTQESVSKQDRVDWYESS